MKEYLFNAHAPAGIRYRMPAAHRTTDADTADLPPEAFMRISGTDLITSKGQKFFIKGTNLGNWLNPEGYCVWLQQDKFAGTHQPDALRTD